MRRRAVIRAASGRSCDRSTSATAGEVGWGGLAGTLWWINPRLNVAAVLLTQRYFGYAHPYGLRFKRQAYQALMAR